MKYDKHLERLAKNTNRLSANRAEVLIHVQNKDNQLVATDCIELLVVKDDGTSKFSANKYTNVKTNESVESVNFPDFNTLLDWHSVSDSNQLLSLVKKTDLSDLKAYAKGATTKNVKIIKLVIDDTDNTKLVFVNPDTNDQLFEVQFTSALTNFKESPSFNVRRMIKLLEMIAEFQRSEKDKPVYFQSLGKNKQIYVSSDTFTYMMAPIRILKKKEAETQHDN